MEITDWGKKLSFALRNYATLTVGSVIDLNVDGVILKMGIERIQPDKYKTCMLVKESYIDIRVLDAQETLLAPKVVDAAAAAVGDNDAAVPFLFSRGWRKRRKEKQAPFRGTGHPIGGLLPESNRTPASYAAEAVLRRMAAKK
jgi:hypothetical protein